MEFEAAVEPHRHELRVHCYRMLGSAHDADDLVQETMLHAWRAYATYDPERASIRTWLYRIAHEVVHGCTDAHACLNALESRKRRPLPSGIGPVFDDPEAALAPGFEVPWLQPLPVDPAASAVERSRLRLAFVAALQLLPPAPAGGPHSPRGARRARRERRRPSRHDARERQRRAAASTGARARGGRRSRRAGRAGGRAARRRQPLRRRVRAG